MNCVVLKDEGPRCIFYIISGTLTMFDVFFYYFGFFLILPFTEKSETINL
jgi:hypothetical protein